VKKGYLDYIGLWVVVDNLGRSYIISNPEDIDDKFVNKEVLFKLKGTDCIVYGNTP
jgi:hypothetical protein